MSPYRRQEKYSEPRPAGLWRRLVHWRTIAKWKLRLRAHACLNPLGLSMTAHERWRLVRATMDYMQEPYGVIPAVVLRIRVRQCLGDQGSESSVYQHIQKSVRGVWRP
jgi:hypothetical protein